MSVGGGFEQMRRAGWEFETLASNLGFVEGPVILEDSVIVVSLDRGHLYKIDDAGPELLSAPGGAPNGAAVDKTGTLFIAQNGGFWPGMVRRSQPGGLQAVHPDGRVSWITMDPAYPTDLCIGPDNLVYLTDSTRNQRYDDGRIWRCDPVSGASELLYSVPWFPNGIDFGPDGRLYVASSGNERVYVCEWEGGRIGAPREFCRFSDGRPDGLAFDTDGVLYVAMVGANSGPGFIARVAPNGEIIDHMNVGSSTYYTNLALAVNEPRLILTDATNGAVLMTRDHGTFGFPSHPFREASSW